MLTHADLYSLEQYARIRPQFRARVIEHKKLRRVPLGEHATLHFEDALTMQYQIQEMLRLERIFEPEGIQEELDVYNPLIPDGRNWKATFMLEFPEEARRRAMLARLIGIERTVWIQVRGYERVGPIANEDLERQTADKTASVHFLRFELATAMIADLKTGAPVAAGIDHPQYYAVSELADQVRRSLVADLA